MADLSQVAMEKLAARFREIRDRKAEMEAAHKKALAPLDAAMAQLSTAMLAKLHREKATNTATPAGTVYIHTQQSATIVDFDKLWEKIKEHDIPEILQRRITLSEVTAFNETHPDDPLPGIAVETVQSARVRAPKK